MLMNQLQNIFTQRDSNVANARRINNFNLNDQNGNGNNGINGLAQTNTVNAM